MRLLLGDRTVLDPTRDHEEIAFMELDVPVPKLNRQPALQDEEEVVGVRVRVPDELTLDLDDGELVLVVVADDPRRERLVERRELLGEINSLVQGYSAASIWAFWSRPE